jgi:HEAT repeat protein
VNSSAANERKVIWLKTLLVLAFYAWAIVTTHELLFKTREHEEALSIALSFAVVQSIVIVILIIGLVIRKYTKRIAERRAERIAGIVRNNLSSYILGDSGTKTLRALHEKFPQEVERSFISFYASVTGESRKRLHELAAQMGFLEHWARRTRSRLARRRLQALQWLSIITPMDPTAAQLPIHVERLGDRSEPIRIQAAQTLAKGGTTAGIETVFYFLLTQPLFVRALLADELRPHVPLLATRAVPNALRSTSPRKVAAALDLLLAWEKALTLPQIATTLTHPEPAVRERALSMLPWLSGIDDASQWVQRGLSDPDERVRAAAARSAGALAVRESLSLLVQCLHQSAPVAQAAAQALARLGPEGEQALEQQLFSENRTVAAVALEALEKMKIAAG